MNWRLKSVIQNLVDNLPLSWSYAGYYWIQRNFGGLRRVRLNPVARLYAAVEVNERLLKVDRNVVGRTVLEIGTGRRINCPLGLWIIGAERVITVDLNPYLKEELVRDDIAYMRSNRAEIERLFEGVVHENRLDDLLSFTRGNWHLDELMRHCGIEYIAPGDATALPLPNGSIDIHTSCTVLEHIPPEILRAMITEGSRLLRKDGVFIHVVDYSDHFAHSDPSISAINFLRFSDAQWKRLAGNRFMYANRLRIDDLHAVFASMEQRIILDEPYIHDPTLDLLRRNALELDPVFRDKPEHVLATTHSWIVSEKAR